MNPEIRDKWADRRIDASTARIQELRSKLIGRTVIDLDIDFINGDVEGGHIVFDDKSILQFSTNEWETADIHVYFVPAEETWYRREAEQKQAEIGSYFHLTPESIEQIDPNAERRAS